MAREYTNIADAISAVNDEVSAQTTQIADILTALEGKSGGGLPSSITKIDGGSFTPDADGRCDITPITHNLSERPKGFVVWTDELYAFQSASRIYVTTIFAERKTFETAVGASSYGVLSYANRTTGGGVGSSSILLSETQANGTFTDTQFRFQFDNRYYKANTTYKWLAWA